MNKGDANGQPICAHILLALFNLKAPRVQLRYSSVGSLSSALCQANAKWNIFIFYWKPAHFKRKRNDRTRLSRAFRRGKFVCRLSLLGENEWWVGIIPHPSETNIEFSTHGQTLLRDIWAIAGFKIPLLNNLFSSWHWTISAFQTSKTMFLIHNVYFFFNGLISFEQN